MERQIPKIFDWVKARTECSAPGMFLLFTEALDSDVKAIQGRMSNALFELRRMSQTKVVVAKKWDAGGIQSADSVVFELLAGAIQVKHGPTERVMFRATPMLDEDGDCRLEIEGESGSLELWQVSCR